MRKIQIKKFKRTIDDVACYNLCWDSFDENSRRHFAYQSLSLTREELIELKKCLELALKTEKKK